MYAFNSFDRRHRRYAFRWSLTNTIGVSSFWLSARSGKPCGKIDWPHGFVIVRLLETQLANGTTPRVCSHFYRRQLMFMASFSFFPLRLAPSSRRDSALHPRYKTEICVHWLMHGDCSYGKERCNFAHGEDDLIALAESPRPGASDARGHPGAVAAAAARRVRNARSGSGRSLDASVRSQDSSARCRFNPYFGIHGSMLSYKQYAFSLQICVSMKVIWSREHLLHTGLCASNSPISIR